MDQHLPILIYFPLGKADHVYVGLYQGWPGLDEADRHPDTQASKHLTVALDLPHPLIIIPGVMGSGKSELSLLDSH